MEPRVGGSRTSYTIVSESAREPDPDNIICSPDRPAFAHRDAARMRAAIDLSRLYEFRSGIRIKIAAVTPTGWNDPATGSTAIFMPKANAREFYCRKILFYFILHRKEREHSEISIFTNEYMCVFFLWNIFVKMLIHLIKKRERKSCYCCDNH